MKLLNKYIDKISNKVILQINGLLDEKISNRFDKIQNSLGRIEARQIELKNSTDIHNNEFKVYSQWGEDGIIQYLINNIEIKNKIFIEFGVQNYVESNTRFLLINNNWSGLVLDSSMEYIDYIKSDDIYWKHNLKAEQHFVTVENINNIIKNAGIPEDIGILSIDIDGNDYWIWKTIDIISPRIVICEYNSLFGQYSSVVIPYKNDFTRHVAHFSGSYFGASIKAFNDLALQKGYSLVGSNSAGNNLFFVRNDLKNNFKILSHEEAYVKCQYRESRDSSGALNYSNFEERLNFIKDMPLYDLESNKMIKAADIKLGKEIKNEM